MLSTSPKQSVGREGLARGTADHEVALAQLLKSEVSRIHTTYALKDIEREYERWVKRLRVAIGQGVR